MHLNIQKPYAHKAYRHGLPVSYSATHVTGGCGLKVLIKKADKIND